MAHEPNTELAVLFPELREWNDGGGITVSDWLGTFGSVPQTIAYSTLFWPEFVEHEGCLLWNDFSPTNFDDWMVSLKGNKTRVEAVINHIHITGLFYSTEAESPEQIGYLGTLLQRIWTLKLQNDFPLLRVQVEFHWHDQEDFEDVQIVVYCQRD